MRQEWIEDILAVLEAGSLTAAAEQRFVTQSAFTRRIRSIELALGVEVFDRTRKPLQLLPHVLEQEQAMRNLLVGLNALRNELSDIDAGAHQRVSLACQHTIETTLSPRLIRQLTQDSGLNMNIKADNRDKCLMMLLTSEVDLAIVYESTNEKSTQDLSGFLEKTLGVDQMVPVVASEFSEARLEELQQGRLRMVSYRSGIYFGSLFESQFVNKVSSDLQIVKSAETGLALAALHYILEGIGVGWIPLSIAEPELQSGRLNDWSDKLPISNLTIKIVRLQHELSSSAEQVWQTISNDYQPVMESQWGIESQQRQSSK